MTDIEKILEKNRLKTDHYADQEFEAYGIVSIESAMKEYAEFYAKKCLEIAAEEAEMKYEKLDYQHGARKVTIDKDSILNIKLPEHA